MPAREYPVADTAGRRHQAALADSDHRSFSDMNPASKEGRPVIPRLLAAMFVALALTFSAAVAASAHEINPPNGGLGDTPLNSNQAVAHALDNFEKALENGQAENSLLRNPTCGAHSVHPPGNP
jgi:hypothetical protein